MTGKVAAIAGNAFRETIRQPVFCVVLGVAAAMIALSPTFTMFTLMESVKLVKDIGLSTILLAGLLLAVLSASNVVTEEIRGRTALMVLSRPVGRGEFVVGKFLGIVLAQLVAAYLLGIVLVLTARIGVKDAAYTKLDTAVAWGELAAVGLTLVVAAGANYLLDKPFPSAVVASALVLFTLLFVGLGFVDKELKAAPFLSAMDGDTIRACIVLVPTVSLLTAAAVACATRLSLVLSIVACSLVFMLGMLSDYLFGRHAADVVAARIAYRLLPNLQVFWMGDALSAEKGIPWSYVALAFGYGALVSAALLLVAMSLFETREIQ